MGKFIGKIYSYKKEKEKSWNWKSLNETMFL
jgi:hypothetical protein